MIHFSKQKERRVYPEIKIELESMKCAIIKALDDKHVEIEEYVNEAIERVIASFDFDKVVSEVVRQTLTDSIVRYYRTGEGRDYISEAVNHALARMHGMGNDSPGDKTGPGNEST